MKKLCSGWLITGIILMCGGCKSSFFDYNSTPGGSGKAESVTVEAYPAAVAPLKKSKIDPVEEANIPKHTPANKGKLPLFAGINKMRFSRPVVPGDVLKMTVQFKRMIGGICIASCEAIVDGEKAASGEILCALQEA